MNQQYPDTLHLAISVATTSSHFLLQFSSPTPFSHSILPFSSSVFSFRFLLPFVLSFRSLLFILLSSIPLFHLPYRLSFCLPSCLPFQSVSYKSDKHTENKNPTTICLLQTEGYSILPYFPPTPLCLFSEPPRNTLKTRTIPDFLSYRLQEDLFKALKNTPLSRSTDYRLRGVDTLLRLLPLVSVSRPSAEHSENKSHTGFSLLQTAGGGHQSEVYQKSWTPKQKL